MKSTILLSALLTLLTLQLISMDFQVEKVNEFAITSYRNLSVNSNNVIIEYPYIYTLTDYGLEVYWIENDGSLNLITRLPIIQGSTIKMIDDYLYIGTRKNHYHPFNALIYKIVIYDPANPGIANTLELNEEVAVINGFYKVADNVLISSSGYGIFYNPIISSDLEIVMENDFLDSWIIREQIGENLILVEMSAFNYVLYDLSSLDNITLVGSGNISQAHNNYGFFDYEVYQETKLIISGQTELSVWDIIQPFEWQLLFSINLQNSGIMNYGWFFNIYDHYLFYLNGYDFVVIDLNNFSLHQVLPMGEYACTGIDAVVWNDNLYLTTGRRGIQRFVYNEGLFSWSETIGDYFEINRVFQNGDYLFVSNAFYHRDGIIVFDISDPLNICEVNWIDPGFPQILHLVDSDLLILRKLTETFEYYPYLEIHDVTDPLNPYLRNTIHLDNWNTQQYVWTLYDRTEPDMIYFVLRNQRRLLKFDISEINETFLVFDFDLQTTYSSAFVINNGVIYQTVQRGTSDWYDLRIISGIRENDPEILTTVTYFGRFTFSADLTVYDGYLSAFNYIGHIEIAEEYHLNTRFFDTTELINPVLTFETTIPGRPYLMDEVMFQSGSSMVNVYDLSYQPSGIIDPIDRFLNNGWAIWMFFQEMNSNKYLYCASSSAIGVYEYSYYLSAEEDFETPLVTKLAQNYPNPFNPETRIDFYLHQEGRVNLEIFNIRGQRVDVLIEDILSEGVHSVIWRPRKDQKKEMPSGVYFYRLQTKDYVETKKMLFLK